jgi:hypothetical protein
LPLGSPRLQVGHQLVEISAGAQRFEILILFQIFQVGVVLEGAGRVTGPGAGRDLLRRHLAVLQADGRYAWQQILLR